MSNWSGEKGTADKWVDDNAAEMAEMSDKIFGYAEPGLREYKSSKLLIDFLKRNGFDVETGVSRDADGLQLRRGGRRAQSSASSPSTTPPRATARNPSPGTSPLYPTAPGSQTPTTCSASPHASPPSHSRRRLSSHELPRQDQAPRDAR